MRIDWEQFKSFVDSKSLSIQWIDLGAEYWLKAFDSNFSLECVVNKTTNDCEDFEDNYKNNGNKPLKTEVVTQFEKDDKVLKLASGTGTVGGDGCVTIEIQVPGTYADGLGRWVDSGRIWFDPKHIGDKVEKVEVVDVDGTIAPAGTVVRRWHDDGVASGNQGWFIPTGASGIEVTSLGGYGFIPGGLYLRVKAKKGESQTTGTLFLNIKWGENE